MNRSLTGIIIFFVAILIAQENVQSEENIQDSLKVGASRIIPGIPPVNGYPNGNGNKFVETGNRLPQLLRDVKVYLSDAVIADPHRGKRHAHAICGSHRHYIPEKFLYEPCLFQPV